MKSLWEQFQDQLENEPLWVITNFEQFKEWHDRCYGATDSDKASF